MDPCWFESGNEKIPNLEEAVGEVDFLQPSGRAEPLGNWSNVAVVSAGRLAFLSGITARRADGTMVEANDIESQTVHVCEIIKSTMESIGGSLANVVSLTVFVTDISQFETIHDVRYRYWPVEPPTSTMVEVSRLVDPRSMIEITAIAVL